MVKAKKGDLCISLGNLTTPATSHDPKRLRHLLESLGIDPVVDHRTLLVRIHQTRPLENREVLGYGRLTYIEPQGERSNAIRV